MGYWRCFKVIVFWSKSVEMEEGDFDPGREVVARDLLAPVQFEEFDESIMELFDLVRSYHESISRDLVWDVGDASSLLFSVVSAATSLFKLTPFQDLRILTVLCSFLSVHSQVLEVFVPGARRDEMDLRRALSLFEVLFYGFADDELPFPVEDLCNEALATARALSEENAPPEAVSYFRDTGVVIIERLCRFRHVVADREDLVRGIGQVNGVIERVYSLYRGCERFAVPVMLVRPLLHLSCLLSMFSSIVVLKEALDKLMTMVRTQRNEIHRPMDKDVTERFLFDSLELLVIELRVWTSYHEDKKMEEMLNRVQRLVGELVVDLDSRGIEKWSEIASMFWKTCDVQLTFPPTRKLFEMESEMSRENYDKFSQAMADWKASRNSVAGCSRVLEALLDVKEGEKSVMMVENSRLEMIQFLNLLLFAKVKEDMERLMALMVRTRALCGNRNVFARIYRFLKEVKPNNRESYRRYLIYLRLLSLMGDTPAVMKYHPDEDVIKDLLTGEFGDQFQMETVALAQMSWSFDWAAKKPQSALPKLREFLGLSHFIYLESLERQRRLAGVYKCVDLLKAASETSEAPLKMRQQLSPKLSALMAVLEQFIWIIDDCEGIDREICSYLLNLALAVLFEEYKPDEEIDELVQKFESLVLIPVNANAVMAGFAAISHFDEIQSRADPGLSAQFEVMSSCFTLCDDIPEVVCDRVLIVTDTLDKCYASEVKLQSLKKYIGIILHIRQMYYGVRTYLSMDSEDITDDIVTFTNLLMLQAIVSKIEQYARLILGDELQEAIKSYPLVHTLTEITNKEKVAERKRLIDDALAKIDYMNPELLNYGFTVVQHVERLALRVPSYHSGGLKHVMADIERALQDFVITGDHIVLQQVVRMGQFIDKVEIRSDEEQRLAVTLSSFVSDARLLWTMRLLCLYVERSDLLSQYGETLRPLVEKLPDEIEDLEGVIAGSLDTIDMAQLSSFLVKDIEEAKTCFNDRIVRMKSEIAALRDQTAEMRFAVAGQKGGVQVTPSVPESDVDEVRRERDSMYANPKPQGNRATFNRAISVLLEDSMSNEPDTQTIAPEVSFAHYQLSDSLKTRARVDRGLRILRFNTLVPDMPVPEQIKLLCEHETGKSWVGQEDSQGLHKLRQLRELQAQRDELYKKLVHTVHDSTRSGVRNSRQIKELLDRLRELEGESEANANKHNFGDVHTRYLAMTNDLYQFILADIASLEGSIDRYEKQFSQTREERCRSLQSLMTLGEQTINTRR